MKAGEGYFSPDGRRIVFQAVPKEYPFYQIYTQSLDPPSKPQRISTGRGRTTCSYFHPDGRTILFASSHLDPQLDATESQERQQLEAEKKSGKRRRYSWVFDPHMDIFELRDENLVPLTDSKGYDAECAYSPDGGPFFSPDGRWIVYRTDRKKPDHLQIHVIRADGEHDQALTDNIGVNWAPYWHPHEPYIIWCGADHSDPKARPNYDLWLMEYSVENGKFTGGKQRRITLHPSADVLPVFSPDGKQLMWTSNRGEEGSSQLWHADFILPTD